MNALEGPAETERQIARVLRAWAVDRRGPYMPTETLIVFGTCRSDAVRRASSPARLGEGVHGDETRATRILSGWDEPIEWPTPWPAT